MRFGPVCDQFKMDLEPFGSVIVRPIEYNRMVRLWVTVKEYMN